MKKIKSPKLTGAPLHVMSAILGVSNAGSDHLFCGTRAEFLPCDAAELARSQYTRSVDDATLSIVRGLCENMQMVEMFQAEARSWEKTLSKMTVDEIEKQYRYPFYVKAVAMVQQELSAKVPA